MSGTNSPIAEADSCRAYEPIRVGMVSARIAEMVLRDEKAVVPIGSYHKEYGATFSLPSVVGRGAVIDVMEPDMSDDTGIQAGIRSTSP